MNIYRSGLKWICLVIAVGLLMGWAVFAQEKARERKNVIILPGTAISKDDEEAMNRILKQYDQSLYRIDTYEKGQLKKTRGTLSDIVIGRKLMSQVAANARKNGFTQYALRIGLAEGGVGHVPSPSPGGAAGVGHTTPTPGMATGVGRTTPTPGMATGVGHTTPTPTEMKNPPHVTPAKAQSEMDSAELVRKLKPIFDKYSKQ